MALRLAPSLTCGRGPASRRAPRRAASSSSRTPRSARAPRCPTSHTSATPRWGPDPTSGPARSLPTTTASTRTGRRRRLMATLEERPQVVSSIPQDYTKRMMVFGGRASMELAARIAGKLDVDLGQADLRTFADGGVYCRYEESIRGADVFLVQSTAANAAAGMTPNDSLLELLVMIDAAKGASAHRIIAVMPWYGYSRQDKKSAPREPISARV